MERRSQGWCSKYLTTSMPWVLTNQNECQSWKLVRLVVFFLLNISPGWNWFFSPNDQRLAQHILHLFLIDLKCLIYPMLNILKIRISFWSLLLTFHYMATCSTIHSKAVNSTLFLVSVASENIWLSGRTFY